MSVQVRVRRLLIALGLAGRRRREVWTAESRIELTTKTRLKESASMLESFERGFTERVSGCRRTCDCGREFYDAFNRGYDWDDGELESLQADAKVTGLDYSVGTLYFEGRHCVLDCECWKGRGNRIAAFLIEHREEIGRFFDEERKRHESEARSAAVTAKASA